MTPTAGCPTRRSVCWSTHSDPVTIIDHATYTKPDQLSTGVDYIIVNGQLKYEGGKLTGITAGRTLRGRGYPSNQFVYVANSGDGTVSGYALTLASPYLTPLSGAPWTVGTTPSALVTDPLGSYLYVANSGSDSISAFTIDPLTGALTTITGTFPTSGSPSALAVSNNGSLLYVTDKDIGELQQFTINSDGSLTSAGGGGVGTATTSVTTIGTYK